MTDLVFGLLAALTPSSPPTLRAMGACSAISSSTGVQSLNWPLEAANSKYTSSANHYWSTTNENRNPACVVLPTSAQDVSNVIQVLLQYPDVQFAVKSGGHNPNVNFSSTTGVLISFSNMDSSTLSPDRSIAYVEPGATWGKCIGDLEPYGVAVVGGRVGDVGVGGLLVGCGLSFLSAQYGLPCDHVINYEVVLSNGTIVNANAQSHSDLFFALKGGGNQFGIITQFSIKTIPMGLVWGGYRLYDTSPEIDSTILNATQDFTENPVDPRAGIIVTVELLLDNLSQFWALFFFYNGPELPSGIFDKFPTNYYFDNTKTQNYSSLLNSNANLASIYGLRYLLRGQTIPNLPGQTGTDLVNANYQNFRQYVYDVKSNLGNLLSPLFVFNFIYQPIPYGIAAASIAANPAGNLLGLSPYNGDYMWMACTLSWEDEENDTEAWNMITGIMDGVVEYTQTMYSGNKSSNFFAGAATLEYTPAVFMNDAMVDQQVLQGYGAGTYQRLKSIQRAYDQIGFFPNRTGGFKYT